MKTWNGLRYSVRALRREPAFAVLAILTVALGIGANTAIFSIVNGVLLRPLPYAAPDRLVALREVLPVMAQTYPTLPVSARHFVEWRQRTKSFERISAIDQGTTTLTDGSAPERLDVLRVSADLFRTLGVQAGTGRTFVDGEDQQGGEGVALLSDALWRRRFGADPRVVGRAVLLDSRPVVVVGVLPAEFRSPSLSILPGGKSAIPQPDIFVPLVFSKEEIAVWMGRFNYNVIARLRPGATAAQAAAELNLIAVQLAKTSGEDVVLHASVAPLLDSVTGPARQGLIVLLGAVGAVLLIVCVNLANLMLARAERHAREVAVQRALGAGTGRLVRQGLTEALLIAVLGGAFGVAVAASGLDALVRSAPPEIPRLAEVHLDARVLLFAAAITTATGLLFGILPAWRATRVDTQAALKAGGRTATGGAGGLRLRSALVVAEVTLSVILLAAAGLLMTSFARVMRAEKGFRAPAVLAADVQIPEAKYRDDTQRNQFHQRVLARMAAQPGVLSAALITALPLQGETWIDNVAAAGDKQSEWQQQTANVRFVSPDYFRAMGIALRSGRPFRENDSRTAAIVSEGLAHLLWPGQDAVGHRLKDGDATRQVVGVAGDVRVEPDKPPVAMVYRPYWDWSPSRVVLVARSAGDPRSIAGAMRVAVSSVDRDVPLAKVRTMQEVLEGSVAARRFQMLLAAAFAAAALLLAALGIYGVVSYSVARRTQETGIRMALGAQTWQLCAMVLVRALTPVALGLLIGIGGAVALGRVLRSLLYQASPGDPGLLAITALAIAAVGLAASLLPARRAIRMDPLAALREE